MLVDLQTFTLHRSPSPIQLLPSDPHDHEQFSKYSSEAISFHQKITRSTIEGSGYPDP